MNVAPQPFLTAYLEVVRETISHARSLAYGGKGQGKNVDVLEQIGDLLDAIHVIPELLDEWERCDEESLRKTYLQTYDKKWVRNETDFSMLKIYNKNISK